MPDGREHDARWYPEYVLFGTRRATRRGPEDDLLLG